MPAKPDYEALFRVSPYPYMLLDPQLNIIDANPAYLAVTGAAAADAIGRPVFEAFPENADDPQSTNLVTAASAGCGKGSVFTVALPLLPGHDSVQAAAPGVDGACGARAPLRLLVVTACWSRSPAMARKPTASRPWRPASTTTWSNRSTRPGLRRCWPTGRWPGRRR